MPNIWTDSPQLDERPLLNQGNAYRHRFALSHNQGLRRTMTIENRRWRMF
jgi:hypothetical protein